MGLRLPRGRAARLLAAALASALTGIAAVPAAAADAPPANDVATAPDAIQLADLQGVRALAFDATTKTNVVGVDVSAATTAADDPLLQSFGTGDSSCNAVSGGGPRLHTVWYRLLQPDGSGPLKERTWVTLDTSGSTYANAIAVFRSSIAPENEKWCERGNLASLDSGVTFLTEPGIEYYVMVASVAGTGALNLWVRATDAQPPTAALDLSNVLGSPGQKVTATLHVEDAGSGLPFAEGQTPGIGAALPTWAIRWAPSGTDPATPSGTDIATVSYDATKTSAEFNWPDTPLGARKLRGLVQVSVVDNAGNVSTVSLRVVIRDRTPPDVVDPSVAVGGPHTDVAVFTGQCSETGSLQVVVQKPGPRRRNRTRPLITLRTKTMPVKAGGKIVGFQMRNLPLSAYVATFRCTDWAGLHSGISSYPFIVIPS